MVGGGNKALESSSEFSMQQEDFPALPGSMRKLFWCSLEEKFLNDGCVEIVTFW